MILFLGRKGCVSLSPIFNICLLVSRTPPQEAKKITRQLLPFISSSMFLDTIGVEREHKPRNGA